MAWLFGKDKEINSSIKWTEIKDISELDNFDKLSFEKPIVYFKHSTRCSISSMAKNKFERKWNLTAEDITPIYLDLIAHRDISNELANRYNIIHQSPQILVIKEGKCIHTATHQMISSQKVGTAIGK